MVSGFSFIKNGESLGYPYKEALLSLTPLVDELVVAHGDSQDNTLEALESLSRELPCKVRLIPSPWNPENLRGGLELSRQTNIALDACTHEICLYIQGDEVLHEDDYPLFREDLKKFSEDPEVAALAFPWIHFYGNFYHYVHSRKWYRREIRAVKKSSGLRSYGDAQGFRIPQGSSWIKAAAALGRAPYRHYGWVRPPQKMLKKTEAIDRLWHGDAKDGTHKEAELYKALFGLRKYTGSHPKVLRDRILALEGFDPFVGKSVRKDSQYWSLQISDWIEKITDWRPGEFKNYSSLKKY